MSLKVYNPSAGRWFILHWWTDHDRGHLSFAKTTDELKEVARRVFEKEPEADFKGLYEIEMVGPSERMDRLAEKHDHQEAVSQFYYEVCGRIKEAMDAGKKPPGPFELCEKFETEDDVESKDEWANERHYSCKNCDMNLKLVGMTKDGLYDKYAGRWYTIHPPFKYKPSPKVPRPVPSQAKRAEDDEQIWFAYGNFGHHAGGIELEKVDLSDAEEYRPRCLSEQALFFYRLIRKLTDSTAHWISQTIKAAKVADKKATKEREIKRKKERQAEEKKRVQDLLSFFRE